MTLNCLQSFMLDYYPKDSENTEQQEDRLNRNIACLTTEGCFARKVWVRCALGTGDAAGEELMKWCVHAAS